MASYEPNLEGAITVLVDLLTANGFTMTRSPYASNYRGLVDAVIDLKEGFVLKHTPHRSHHYSQLTNDKKVDLFLA